MYCTLLFSTELYWTLMYCTLLFSTELYRTLLNSDDLYSTLFCSTLLQCTVLCYTIQYSTVLYCTVLYCTVLYSTLLYSTLIYSTPCCLQCSSSIQRDMNTGALPTYLPANTGSIQTLRTKYSLKHTLIICKNSLIKPWWDCILLSPAVSMIMLPQLDSCEVSLWLYCSMYVHCAV